MPPISQTLVHSIEKKVVPVVQSAAETLTKKLLDDVRKSFQIPDDKLEMYEDYLVFRAAGLLDLWQEKWSGYLPIRFDNNKATL